MTPEQKDRYARQIRLGAIGEKGQQAILDAHASADSEGAYDGKSR